MYLTILTRRALRRAVQTVVPRKGGGGQQRKRQPKR